MENQVYILNKSLKKIKSLLICKILCTSLIIVFLQFKQSSIPNKVPTNETAASTQIENKTSKSSGKTLSF